MRTLSPKASRQYKIVATILLVIQILFTAVIDGIAGPYVSPVILALSGIGLGYILIKLSVYKLSKNQEYAYGSEWISSGIWFAGFSLSLFLSRQCFSKIAISQFDATKSDIIPQLMFMVRRFLSGEFPYKVISNWGYDLFPTYQVLQWMPYTIAEYFSFDYRWISFGVLTLALLVVHWSVRRSSCSAVAKYLINLFSWGIIIVYILGNPKGYSVTAESLIAGYYLLLSLALFYSSRVLQGLSLALCLLSRYSVVLWIPLLFFTMFYGRAKEWLTTGFVVLAAVLLFYAPFVLQEPSITLKGYQYHEKVAKKHWSPQSQLDQYLFKNGFGVAHYYRSVKSGSHLDKLKKLQNSQLVVCFAFLFLAAFYYHRNNKEINNSMFLLGSLQVYLMLFYTFIQLPFDYLFLTPLYVGFFCFCKILSYDGVASDANSTITASTT